VFPAIIVSLMDVQQSWAMFFWGTSLIIMVGVAMIQFNKLIHTC
jgi:preprotein translocase subunit SecY